MGEGGMDVNHSLKHATVHQTNSNYTSPVGEVKFVRVASRLSISPVSEEDIGQYWCKVLSPNGTVLAARSNILTLEREEVYNSFAPCPGPNSIIQRDCATLDEPTQTPIQTTAEPQMDTTSTELKLLLTTDATATMSTTMNTDTEGPVTVEESNIPAIIVHSVPTTILVMCILVTILIFITILLRLKYQQCTAADDDTPQDGSNSPHYEVIDVDDIVAKTTAVKQTQSSPPVSMINESYDDIVPPPIVAKRRQGLPGFAITNNVAYYLDPRKTVP